MSLFTTQKFVLAALLPENKLSVLKKGTNGICLVTSCIWDMLYANVAVLNEKGQMAIASGLPDELEYCRPIYEELVSKANKLPKKIILDYTTSLTDKRIADLAKGIVMQLSNQGYLKAIEDSGLFGQITWKPTENLLKNNFSVESDIMFAVLLLESGLAKKQFTKSEIEELREKVIIQDTSNIQPYLKNMMNLVKQEITNMSANASAIASAILFN